MLGFKITWYSSHHKSGYDELGDFLKAVTLRHEKLHY